MPAMKFISVLLLLAAVRVLAEDDPLAGWRSGVTVRPVTTETNRHTIHSYFNTYFNVSSGPFTQLYVAEAKR
jgi:hypothetical protein